MSEKGIIFDIKKFAIHDGPGIRSTVFLKGCPISVCQFDRLLPNRYIHCVAVIHQTTARGVDLHA